jgi:hypothetical protein
MVWDDERVWAVVTVIVGTPLATWVKGRWDTRRGTTERISDAGAAAIEREAARMLPMIAANYGADVDVCYAKLIG